MSIGGCSPQLPGTHRVQEFLLIEGGIILIGLLQFLGTDDSGAGTHRELVDLGRERPLGSTLTGNDFPGEVFPEVLPGR